MTRYLAALFVIAAALLAEGQSRPLHVIPVELYRNAVWLPVSVSGSKPLSFILDSGAGRCVVARDAAERLGLQIVELGEMDVSPSEKKVRMAASPDVTFAIGASTVMTHAGVVPFEVPSAAWGKRFEGAIGYEWFARYVVEVDFDGRRVNLYDPETYEYHGAGTILPIRLVGNAPVTRVEIGFPGAGPLEGDFMIDLGGTMSIVFNTPFVRQYNLISAAQKMVPRLIDSPHIGVGGAGRRLLGRVQFAQVGPYRIATPLAGFAQAESGQLARKDMAGLLGCNLLHRFNIVFDYKRQHVILQPNSHFSDLPEEYDMSGIGLGARGENFSEFYVNSVAPESPAARAGIQPGDILIAVDGKPVKGFLLDDITNLFTEAGAGRKLLVSRKGQQREFRLVLRKVL
jgi:hypothetical protein